MDVCSSAIGCSSEFGASLCPAAPLGSLAPCTLGLIAPRQAREDVCNGTADQVVHKCAAGLQGGRCAYRKLWLLQLRTLLGWAAQALWWGLQLLLAGGCIVAVRLYEEGGCSAGYSEAGQN